MHDTGFVPSLTALCLSNSHLRRLVCLTQGPCLWLQAGVHAHAKLACRPLTSL